ncbi:hypothetical protein ACQP2F_15445 [Actinoplanes sp. CA-030573]|uniref:hypothetical protein n=1 Tax=Actinoplanes sp. CA-030573 TaxID=3239898 RepID=UPI003D93593D
MELPLSLPAATELIGRTLAFLGTKTADSQVLMGAGAIKLNPAVVTVTASEQNGSVHATVRGVAKEGLIRQRAGEKAARLVVQHLTAAIR